MREFRGSTSSFLVRDREVQGWGIGFLVGWGSWFGFSRVLVPAIMRRRASVSCFVFLIERNCFTCLGSTVGGSSLRSRFLGFGLGGVSGVGSRVSGSEGVSGVRVSVGGKYLSATMRRRASRFSGDPPSQYLIQSSEFRVQG